MRSLTFSATMQSQQLTPDVIGSIARMSAFEECAHRQGAELCETMQGQQLTPDVVGCGALMSACELGTRRRRRGRSSRRCGASN